MKKFTITLIAALVAVISWAQPTALKNRQQLPEQFAVKSVSDFKLAPEKKQMAPRPALKAKVQAPVQKTGMRKAPAKVKKIADLSDLATTYVVKNACFDIENVGTEEEPDYQLVPTSVPYSSQVWDITIGEEANTVSIIGIEDGETAVTATVDLENSTITIPYGQVVDETSYGNIAIKSATGAAEALVGTITEEGIEFQDYWYTELVDGNYAGEMWGYIYASEAVVANGVMTIPDEEGDEVSTVLIEQNDYVATVWNFGGFGTPIDITLKGGGKFVIDQQVVLVDSNGNFVTWGIVGNNYPETIQGTGTDTELTFGSDWTIMNEAQTRWYGQLAAATITLTDGTFTYPVLAEAAATPADPSVVFFDFWNGESATVTLNVPAVDVDGNDIISSLLTYQLFTQDAVGNPVALGEPIAYDNEENGVADQKTVVLGEEAKGLTVIGVKSIYTAGGETNESQIAWFEIPQVVEIPEGLEVKEYPVTADAYSGSWTDYTGTALVGVDGTDVYVQGILPHCPNGWAKGTIEDGVVTFPIQVVGSYNGSVYIHLAGYDTETKGLKPVTFTYNADEDIYMSEDIIFANSDAEKLGFYYPYFDGMTIGTETIPELVELPEGAEVVEYPFVGTTYSSGSSTEFESTVNVAVVENDVYVQGLNEYAPEAWVKGTKDEETGNIVFATGQNLGTFENSGTTYQFFMVGYDSEAGAITDVVMTYNEKQDFYELQNDLLVNGKKSSISYYTWYEAGTTIGIQTEFEATFNFNALGTEEDPWPVSTNLTQDGDITEDAVFTEENVSLTISPAAEGVKTPNRYWGTSNGPQLRVYSGTLTFTSTDGSAITKIVFNHNGKWGAGNSADSGEITNDATAKVATWMGNANTVVVSIAANSQIDAITVTTSIKQLPPLVETEAPEDLEAAEWKLEATEIVYYEEEVDEETGEVISEESYEAEAYSSNALVGFYTVEGEEGTEVYIQGLCPELPEAWVKGTLADGKVTIPYSTYFGSYEYIDWDALEYVEDPLFLTAATINDDNSVTLDDVVFTYDAEANTLTSMQTIFINADRREIAYYHWYEGMTLTLIPEFAATPADPIFEKYDFEQEAGYNTIYASIPVEDVDGNALVASKLFYIVWFEKDGKEQQYTFTAALYSNDFDEDVTEVPYDHDGYDIYKGGEIIYLEDDPAELATWTKVGIQSIYYGAGERNESNIVWSDPITTGIANVNVDSKNAVIFDLQGRRVAKATKGLYIVDGKKVVMK